MQAIIFSSATVTKMRVHDLIIEPTTAVVRANDGWYWHVMALQHQLLSPLFSWCGVSSCCIYPAASRWWSLVAAASAVLALSLSDKTRRAFLAPVNKAMMSSSAADVNRLYGASSHDSVDSQFTERDDDELRFFEACVECDDDRLYDIIHDGITWDEVNKRDKSGRVRTGSFVCKSLFTVKLVTHIDNETK